MPITFKCYCGRGFTVKEEMAGKKIRCPKCQNTMRVPVPNPTTDDEIKALRDWTKLTEKVRGKPLNVKPSGSDGAISVAAPPAAQAPRSDVGAPTPLPKTKEKLQLAVAPAEERTRATPILRRGAFWAGLALMAVAPLLLILGLFTGPAYLYSALLFGVGVAAFAGSQTL